MIDAPIKHANKFETKIRVFKRQANSRVLIAEEDLCPRRARFQVQE